MAYCNNREHLFILGSPRSGTSLMASILQNSSVYASYRAETKLLNNCRSKYGDLSNAASRKKFLNDWFKSRQFKRTGLTERDILEATRKQFSYIGFLGSYMNIMAEKQGRQRWVDSTPSNANYLKQISETFPNAKVLHMVRDGRAVALSLAKLGWSGARTSNFNTALSYSALKWQNAVERVYDTKTSLGNRFLEVSYERLVENPVEVINEVCGFLRIPTIDVSLIQSGSVDDENINSTLRTPNSLFGDMTPGISTNAAYRWKTVLDENQISIIEAVIGDSLNNLAYPLISKDKPSLHNALLTHWRTAMLKSKRVMKRHTLLGRLSSSPLEIDFD